MHGLRILKFPTQTLANQAQKNQDVVTVCFHFYMVAESMTDVQQLMETIPGVQRHMSGLVSGNTVPVHHVLELLHPQRQ